MQTLKKTLLIFILAMSTPALVVADLVRLDTETGFDSVYLFENPDAPVVKVALTVLAGEVDFEGPEGLSHYLEHLVFWHADNVGGQQLHSRGGNAWVNGIVTSYYNEGEKNVLNDMLEFVKRIFQLPNQSKKFMLNERSVVAREYDVGMSENPDQRIFEAARKELYNRSPVSRSVIGTPKSIGSLTSLHTTQFHKKFYHPANSVLFIAGNLTKGEAERIVSEQFSDIESGSRNTAGWRNTQLTKTSDIVKEFTDAQVTYERLIYLTLSARPEAQNATENWYTLLLLRAVLDSALEGGIARPLRMDNFILRSFAIELESYLSGYTELVLVAEPDRGVSLEQASQKITETFSALATTGIPAETLERVRSRLLQTEQRNSRVAETHYYRMSRQLSAGLRPVSSSEHLEYISNVTLKQVNSLLDELANPKRRSIALITPHGE